MDFPLLFKISGLSGRLSGPFNAGNDLESIGGRWIVKPERRKRTLVKIVQMIETDIPYTTAMRHKIKV